MKLFLQQTIQPRDPGESGGSGGTPPPAAPATPEADQPGEETNVDFEALSKEFENDANTDPTEQGEPVDTPAPVPPPASAMPPAVPPAAVPTPVGSVPPPQAAAPPATPVVPPVAPSQTPPGQPAPAQPAQPATPAAASPEPLTPEAIEAAYSKFETSMMPQLEARYQGLLTPEMTKMLEEEPAKAIPKLAARIHYHAQVAAYTGVMSQIPRILGTLLEHNKSAETAMGRFESRWPALKDEKYRAQVDQGLATWRNANPKMTTDEMIEKAGLWLMLSMGLNPTPTEPAAPPPSLPGPARPAGVGAPGSPGRIPPGGASNVFEEMAANWNQDDS